MRDHAHDAGAFADALPSRASPPPLLEARGLRFIAGATTLIDGLDLTLSAEGITALMGPSGAGKSLTLRLLHGLERPTAGQLRWADNRAPRQAMVFQKPVLLRRSVAANLDFALRRQPLSRAEARDRRDALLDEVGLRDHADRPARRLSGGEQQRLALARALAADPELLFLDEPTASLDPANTDRIEQRVRAVAARGVKVVFVTHDLGQARRIADDALFLHHGRLVEAGPAPALFDSPASPAARAYFAGELAL